MSDLPSNVHRPTEADWESSPDGPADHGDRYVYPKTDQPDADIGINISELAPGRKGCPLHAHYFEEEHFLVLSGELTVRELAPDDEEAGDYTEYALRTGELVAYPAGTGVAHRFENAGSETVRMLCVSNRVADEMAGYPDSGKVLLKGLRRVGVLTPAGAEPIELDAHFTAMRRRAAGRGVVRLADDARPAHVASFQTCPERALGGGVFGRPLAREAGASQVFLNVDRLTAGSKTGPLHAHTADEEQLYVIAGTPTLRQVRGGRFSDGRCDWSEGVEETAHLEPGDFVRWLPGDGVAHQLVNESSEDVLLAVIGTDRQQDITAFPGRETVYVRAMGGSGRFAPTGYWEGE